MKNKNARIFVNLWHFTTQYLEAIYFMYIVDYNLLGFNTIKSLAKSIKTPLYEGGHTGAI